MTSEYEPDFGCEPPAGYRWLVERGIVGYEDSALAPWYYVKKADAFDINERWPQGPLAGRLLTFARRYDCDDIACFDVTPGVVTGIAVVHGWAGSGYEPVAAYEDFWGWLKSVIDDVAELIDGAAPS